LLLAIVLYAAQRIDEHWRCSVLAGVSCALLLFNRPGDGILVMAVSLFFLSAKTWKAFVLPAVIVSVPFLLYNLQAFGSPVGGYAQIYPGLHAQDSMLEGIAGLLVSPGKGLFVFSPFLLLLLAASPRWFAEAWQKRMAVLLLAGFVGQLIVYGRVPWQAGHCFGPRFLAGMLPALIWLIAPIVDSLSRPMRFAFTAAVALAICMQTAGAFYYPSSGVDLTYEKEPWTLWHPNYNTVVRDVRAGRLPWGG